MISKAVGRRDWKPIKITCSGPSLSHIFFADDILLFAEASVAQIKVIRECLKNFCDVSGQKLSLPKSKNFISPIVNPDVATHISVESGIEITKDLGTYLGVLLLHKRLSKESCACILDKFESKLAGWKANFLSFTGRICLTKSVISALPIYSMSTILLPSAIHKKMGRCCRKFIWSGNASTRNVHKVVWKELIKPMSDDGLGIKDLHTLNLALIAKLGWRLLLNDGSLWSSVLLQKY